MKWLKENKCKSLIAFFGVFIALFTALDKGFDFWEEHIAVNLDKPKVQIVKETSLPNVQYKDKTLFKNKAERTK